MKPTIEQLEKMSSERLLDLWDSNQFPFEKAQCGACLTYHANFNDTCSCPDNEKHKELRAAVVALGANLFHKNGQWLKDNLRQLFAIRMKFNSIYL